MIELKKKLVDVCHINLNSISEYKYDVSNLKMEKIRDYLMLKGEIIQEDTVNKMYLGFIYGGFANKNKAFVCMRLSSNLLEIAIHAKEGIIKQKTIEGVINEFKDYFKEYMA
jgi:hypothetical protein